MRGRHLVAGLAALATASALIHAATSFRTLPPAAFAVSLVMIAACGSLATLIGLRLARESQALQAELIAEREHKAQLERHSCEMYRELESKLEQRTAALVRERDIVVRTEKLNALSRLVGGVAHELNNPLTAILGEAMMLRQRCEAPELSRGLHIIEQQATRCAGLVRDLEAFAGLEQRKVQPLDVHALLEGALSQALLACPSREVSVVRQYWQGGPLVVAGNMEQLQQALVNVISNACQAMAQTESVQLTLRTRRAENGRVCVEISDTGSGIEPASLPYIFDPFYSRPSARTMTVGLGLSVALGLIRAHQGQMAAESEVGKGTTVRIELPEAQLARAS